MTAKTCPTCDKKHTHPRWKTCAECRKIGAKRRRVTRALEQARMTPEEKAAKKAQHSAYMKQRRAKLKSAGICTHCGWRPADEGVTACGPCRADSRDAGIVTRQKHQARGTCHDCSAPVEKSGNIRCDRCRTEHSRKSLERYHQLPPEKKQARNRRRTMLATQRRRAAAAEAVEADQDAKVGTGWTSDTRKRFDDFIQDIGKHKTATDYTRKEKHKGAEA